MKKNNIIMDNKGFSLVELIVTVLITGILMLAVGLFMTTSRNAFQTVNISATLQEESMTVERVLSEALMEASAYKVVTATIDSTAYKVMWIKAKDNNKAGFVSEESLYFFVHDSSKQKLFYCKKQLNDTDTIDKYINASDGSVTSTKGFELIKSNCLGNYSKYNLISDHLVSFTDSSVKTIDGSKLIKLVCNFSYLGTEYTSNITAVSRNIKE